MTGETSTSEPPAQAQRMKLHYGFNEIDRNDNRKDGGASLYGLFAAADYEKATYEIDVAYVDGGDGDGDDGTFLGLGQLRRFGHWNSTLRANFSSRSISRVCASIGILSEVKAKLVPLPTL